MIDGGAVLQYGTIAAVLIGAGVAFRKAPIERTKLSAETSAIAVEAQQRIIDDLQSELGRARERIIEVKSERDEEVATVRRVALEEKAEIRAEVADLREENERLMHRLFRLEERLQST